MEGDDAAEDALACEDCGVDGSMPAVGLSGDGVGLRGDAKDEELAGVNEGDAEPEEVEAEADDCEGIFS